MRVLLVSLLNWRTSARLPRALHDAGIRAGALSVPGGILFATRCTHPRFTFRSWSAPEITEALCAAVASLKPQLLIPCDDETVHYLERLVQYSQDGRVTGLPRELINVIRSSLCAPNYYDTLYRKSALLRVADGAGLRTPVQACIDCLDDGRRAAGNATYPVVFKPDCGVAGSGVSICRTKDELNAVMANHFRPRDAGSKTAGSTVQADHRGACIQQFIPGKTSAYCFVARDGRVLAGFVAVKELVHPDPTGSATVVSFARSDEIEQMSRRLVSVVGYNGFGAVDFRVDQNTGVPHLIEFNACPVQVTHLGRRIGVDLCAALFDHMNGREPRSEHALKTEETVCSLNTPRVERVNTEEKVALFPQEWHRDPHSPNIQSLYHDIPSDEPELVLALKAAR